MKKVILNNGMEMPILGYGVFQIEDQAECERINTNAGYGIGSSFQTVKELCPESNVLEGFGIKGGVERDGVLFVMEGEKEKEARTKIEEWLQKIDFAKQAQSN